LCGHDHFYDHMKVQRSSTPLGVEMHQFTAGTAGAPFYSAEKYPKDEDWSLERVKHYDYVYGYNLITIDGNAATIEFKGRTLEGTYETRDSFRDTVKAP
jgi:Iron/zinc purple acid phosphatase-like protein C